MVYAWDEDGRGDGGLPSGYFGFKFLESPTNSDNGGDDDDDGIIDESPFNDAGFYIDGVTFPLATGINDTAKYIRPLRTAQAPLVRRRGRRLEPRKGRCRHRRHRRHRATSVRGTGSRTSAMMPTGILVSEPNFGIRDVNESDQIGLTSFNALGYTNGVPNVPKNDVFFWQLPVV